MYGPLEDIVRRTSQDVDVFLTGHTHAAYDCVIDRRRVTSAGSYGRLITRIDLEISRRTHDIVRADADNWIVGQDVMRAPDLTALIAHYSRFAAPLRDRLIGRLAGSASRTRDESGESRMGNLVADAQQRRRPAPTPRSSSPAACAPGWPPATSRSAARSSRSRSAPRW